MKTLTKIFYSLMKKNIKFYRKFSAIILLGLIFSGIVIPGLVSTCFAQIFWQQKTDMPTARMSLSSIALDGKIYAIGGQDSAGYRLGLYAYKTVEAYDPIFDSWEKRANLNTGRANFATCVLNGKILAVGGSKNFYELPLKTIEEYDPVSNTWTHKTDMPLARTGPTASLVNDKIYIIGGGDAALETIAENNVYDTLTKKWATIADIPTPRISLQAVVLDGKIYALGGMTGASTGEKSLTTVEEYDPATDTWTKKANMKFPRKYFAACSLNGKIYVFGGGKGWCTGVISNAEEYDPATDTWKEIANMPARIAGPSVAQLNGKVYIIGGDVNDPNPCYPIVASTIYEYNPHPLIESIEVDKSYYKAGIDNVCIITKISDPTGITLMAKIEAPDQTSVDSLQLFDDGNHNDGDAGDSLYANIWPVSSTEQQYYIDLQVTRVDTITTIHNFSTVATFITIGPVEVEKYTLTQDDTIPNPGDKIYFEVTLRNNSSTDTAIDIKANIFVSDTNISFNQFGVHSYGDIPPGETSTTSGYCRIEIDPDYPYGVEITVYVEITSNDYPYWSSTFSIPVIPVNIKEIKEPITRIYPNPTSDVLNIEVRDASNQVLEIDILNVTGTVMYHKEYKNTNAYFTDQIDLSNYTKSVYLLKVRQSDSVYVEKVVVR